MSFMKEGLLILLCIAMHVGGGLLDDRDPISVLPEKNEERNEPFRSFNNGEYSSEKRGTNSKGHSLMFFGKRSPGQKKVADLLQYLQRNQEPSWKRGHSIMRFGKRSGDKHNFIRFGKRSSGLDYDLDGVAHSEDKKTGHSMMYFGKRDSPVGQKKTGHSMMYFGKRKLDTDDPDCKQAGQRTIYYSIRDNYAYDKPDDLEKGDEFDGQDMTKSTGKHSFMYFGKGDGDDDGQDKRTGHSMMYFGKRDGDDDGQDKRTGHSMMYFGKRDGDDDDGQDKRTGHSMMYFGKRDGDDDGQDKRTGHSMMYFGKRDGNDDFSKKSGHSIVHFGKRLFRTAQEPSSWLPASGPLGPINSRYINLFASSPERRQVYDKKKHNMMHFGKRSVEDSYATTNDNIQTIDRANSTVSKSGIVKDAAGAGVATRNKRETNESEDLLLLPVTAYASSHYPDEDRNGDGDLHIVEEEDQLPKSLVIQRRSVEEPHNTKNIFLRFG